LFTKTTSEGDELRPVAEDLDRLEQAAGALERLLGDGGNKVGSTRAGRTGFMIRAIAGLAGYGTNLLELTGKHSDEAAARYALTTGNRRDRINADNLKWLIDTAYAGRKIIVWAHNVHMMNAWYGPGVRQREPSAPERRDEANRDVACRLVWRGPT
jgi:erythromycin esterase